MHSVVFPDKRYGNVSVLEKLLLVLVMIPLPLVILRNVLISPFVSHLKYKTLKRVIGDTAFRHVGTYLSVRQVQYMSGTTRDVYDAWTKQNGLPIVVDDIGDGARLLWFGERRTDKVILYFHGGAFELPALDPVFSFWKYILEKFCEKDNQGIGFAMLNYSLVPTADYPTQLRQTISSIQFLIQNGVDPRNIQLVGDSAGANLILQLFSHLLHPIIGVPRLLLGSKFGGACLMSPWASLSGGDTQSFKINNTKDVFPASAYALFATGILPYVPDSQRMYMEAVKAPDAWFEGVDGIVDRILITAGSAECLKDDIIHLAKNISKHHDGVRFVVQEGGVHNDPYFDFLVKETRLGVLTPLLVAWLAESSSH